MWSWQKKRIKKRTGTNPRRVLLLQLAVGFGLVLILALFATGVWYGSRIERLTITTVTVVGGETIDHSQIKTIAEQELEGTYYRLVPKRFVWTYPENKIHDTIAAIDRVKHVSVQRSGRAVTVIFEEYRPFALWCDTADETLCVFIDREGYAFALAPSLVGGAFLRFSQNDRVPVPKQAAFTKEFIQSVASFSEQVDKNLGLTVVEATPSGEADVTYLLAGGGELKVSLTMSNETVIQNLATILSSTDFDHLEPGNFKYIDLRYGNKIFVNEEIESETNQEATSSLSSSSEESLEYIQEDR